jgi:DNA uptake protein ComE-like DNA-binding protein
MIGVTNPPRGQDSSGKSGLKRVRRVAREAFTVETEDPNRGPRQSGGGGKRRKPQAEDWLLTPSPGVGADPEEDQPQPETLERLDSLEQALKELQERRKPIEATTRAAITRASAAEAKAEDALRQLQSIRAELAGIHDEIAKREEIARQEGSALRDVVAKLSESFATPPESSASPAPPATAPTRRTGNGAHDFPRLASEVERKLVAIEGRVKEADATVRSLLKDDPDPPPVPPSPPGRRRPPDPPDAEPAREPEPESEPESPLIDINRIGFEQLRELGLSVTQAARLLARRDARGQFSSLDQLDDLLDVPRELIDRLKRSLRLG